MRNKRENYLCNLRIPVIGVKFELHRQSVGYVILKGIARETTFVRYISPNLSFWWERAKERVLGIICSPGGCLQGLLTCFLTLSCNMECYEQLSQVSVRLLKMQGCARFCSGTAVLYFTLPNIVTPRAINKHFLQYYIFVISQQSPEWFLMCVSSRK